MGAAGWLGLSLVAGAGWALFHIDVRAREERARAIRGRHEQLSLRTVDGVEVGETATRRSA